MTAPPLAAGRWVRATIGAAVFTATMGMVAANPFTTVAGLGPAWRWGEVSATAGLLIAAASADHRRPGLARAAAATGLLWLVSEWSGWAAGPGLARTVADALGALLPAAAVSLVVMLRPTTRTRAVIGVACAGAMAVAVGRLLLLDPFLDPGCWQLCAHNPLLIDGAAGVGRAVSEVGTAVGLSATLATAWVAAPWGHARAEGGTGKVLGAGSIALLAGAAIPGALRIWSVQDPTGPPSVLGFSAAAVGAVLLAGGIGIEWLRELRLRHALGRLVEDLQSGAPHGSLEAALALALDDPGLRLGFWSATLEGYVDSGGQVLPVDEDGQGTRTRIVRQGRPVAVVHHDGALDSSRIERVLGAAVRLRLENEQLRAATLAELAELRTSRLRIVEAADAERRRLERNLHDGAQQRLVGVALLLRMLRTRDERAVAHEAGARAERLVADMLEELRRLASGIHPAALAYGGLRAAVAALPALGDLTVRVEALSDERHPPGVESAAYLVFAEALADAQRRGATQLVLRGEQRRGRLAMDLVDDAPSVAARHPVAELDDRIKALDGALEVSLTDVGGTRVRVIIPYGDVSSDQVDPVIACAGAASESSGMVNKGVRR